MSPASGLRETLSCNLSALEVAWRCSTSRTAPGTDLAVGEEDDDAADAARNSCRRRAPQDRCHDVRWGGQLAY